MAREVRGRECVLRRSTTEECEIAYFCVAYFTRYRYTPKPLDTDFDKFCVI